MSRSSGTSGRPISQCRRLVPAVRPRSPIGTFRFVELIFGAPAIAFQSLYFEYGSQQGLHRDPMFVVTDPPSHLLASWVALEDITPDSGPLAYVPGSQHLPWYEFEPG